jgi:hypothetical protein
VGLHEVNEILMGETETQGQVEKPSLILTLKEYLISVDLIAFYYGRKKHFENGLMQIASQPCKKN